MMIFPKDLEFDWYLFSLSSHYSLFKILDPRFFSHIFDKTLGFFVDFSFFSKVNGLFGRSYTFGNFFSNSFPNTLYILGPSYSVPATS